MLPKVILHNAVSADACNEGFEVDMELFYNIASRWKEDATLIGSNTILNVKEEIAEEDEDAFLPFDDKPNDNRPVLVVPDSRGRIRNWHYWKKQEHWKKIYLLCCNQTPQRYLDYLSERNIEYLITGNENVDFIDALDTLNLELGIKLVRVDSGSTLNGILLNKNIVNEISLLVHPCIVNNPANKSFTHSLESSLANTTNLKLIHFERLKNDFIWLIYEVIK